MRRPAPRRLAIGLLTLFAAASPLFSEERDPLAPVADTNNPTLVVTGRRAIPTSPDVLGTAAVNSGVTLYDARFRRVSAADRDHPGVRAIAATLAGLSPVDQLERVKAAVARRVRYASDSETLRVSDYWSSAGDTLDRGAGDDEDIAIVEMQSLKAAGFNAADLYISIGRHPVRGAHAVLIARTPQGFYMLDDAEPSIVPATMGGRGARFVPTMTIGAGRSWLHGYRTAGSAR
jgi:predicted transglutaminase-like cysteine proteinase